MHGTLHSAKCVHCAHTLHVDNDLGALLSSGEGVSCQQCSDLTTRGGRPVGSRNRMRADIWYEQPDSNRAEDIRDRVRSDCADKDVMLLIVAGASLATPDAKYTVNDLSRAITARGGRVVNVNPEDCLAELKDLFTDRFWATADNFASLLGAAWLPLMSVSRGLSTTLSPKTAAPGAAGDSRGLDLFSPASSGHQPNYPTAPHRGHPHHVPTLLPAFSASPAAAASPGHHPIPPHADQLREAQILLPAPATSSPAAPAVARQHVALPASTPPNNNLLATEHGPLWAGFPHTPTPMGRSHLTHFTKDDPPSVVPNTLRAYHSVRDDTPDDGRAAGGGGHEIDGDDKDGDSTLDEHGSVNRDGEGDLVEDGDEDKDEVDDGDEDYRDDDDDEDDDEDNNGGHHSGDNSGGSGSSPFGSSDDGSSYNGPPGQRPLSQQAKVGPDIISKRGQWVVATVFKHIASSDAAARKEREAARKAACEEREAARKAAREEREAARKAAWEERHQLVTMVLQAQRDLRTVANDKTALCVPEQETPHQAPRSQKR
ncbi:hypothetical protein HK405_002961, partial [Cladochytrium tenue]